VRIRSAKILSWRESLSAIVCVVMLSGCGSGLLRRIAKIVDVPHPPALNADVAKKEETPEESDPEDPPEDPPAGPSDTTSPTVTNVTASEVNGAYGEASTLNIIVTFSESVEVTGVPALTLETGSTDAQAAYLTGTNSDTLVFQYVVQTGHLSQDLDYVSTSALSVSGASIKDAAGNLADLTLPTPGAAHSLGANKALAVYGSAPTILSVYSPSTPATYATGQSITIRVVTSQPVTVTGSPTLTLETGDADAAASYVSGSGTNELTFTYTVAAGHLSADLDYATTSSLAMNGGSIRNPVAVALNAGLPTPGSANSLAANSAIAVSAVGPVVTSVSTNKADGTYGTGEVISIRVNFNRTVIVTGTPTLTLETGASDAVVSYTSGSSTSTLVFDYTVAAGHHTTQLEYTSAGALLLAGGTILDATGNTATLTLPAINSTGSLGFNTLIGIDAIGPAITSVTTTKADGTYAAGTEIPIKITFNKIVTLSGIPQLLMETGGTDDYATYVSGTGTDLYFKYTVRDGHESSDLDYFSANALTLNGGTLKDNEDNDANVTLPAPGAGGSISVSSNIVIDAVVPTVSELTSTANNGSYGTGERIPIQIVFSEAVTVTGPPRLLVNAAVASEAVYASGSGSTTLVFNYDVTANHSTSDLDVQVMNSLLLNGGTIQDGAGNNAALTLPPPGATHSLGANKDIVINAVSPTVTGVTSSKDNNTYKVGVEILVQVSFSGPVEVTGTPRLEMETGPTTRYATYVERSGNILVFSYTVGAQDSTADLDYKSTSALTLNGGTIRDSLGNPATLTLPSPGATGSLGFAKALVIDGVSAMITNVTSTNANGPYAEGETISIQISFSSSVVVPESAHLAMNAGGYATWAGGNGTTTLTFTYVIGAGATTTDLDYSSTSALTAVTMPPYGTINGNPAVLTLPPPGQGGSLGANKDISIPSVGVPTLARTFEGADSGARMGEGLSPAGDINGDGKADFILGAPGTSNDTGMVSVVSGADGTALFSLNGDAQTYQFGSSVALVGDVNLDGKLDFLVGQPASGEAGPERGKSNIFSGSNGASLYTHNGAYNLARSGSAVTGLGDVDLDGKPDYLIADPLDSSVGGARGRVRVFSGTDGHQLNELFGEHDSDKFGGAVAGVGDVNRDGVKDFIVAATGASQTGTGKVSVYSGAPGTALPMYSVSGTRNGGLFGAKVASVGDINRDGYDDFIVGEARADGGGSTLGGAYVYDGLNGNVIYSLNGSESDGQFGSAVAGAGDVDGDGRPDFLVGEPYALRSVGGAKGKAYLYSGRTGGVLYTITGEDYGDGVGINVSGAGDVNGDGRADFLIANYHMGGGSVSLYYSGFTTPASGDLSESVVLDGTQDQSYVGKTVANAGDVNGDGVNDFLIGEPNWLDGISRIGRVHVVDGRTFTVLQTKTGLSNGGGFGTALASLGDIDNDGKDDFVIGEPGANLTGAVRGRIYVFSGSTGNTLYTIWGEADESSDNVENGSRFGQVVARLKDTSGDGKSEILVGATDWNRAGAVFVIDGGLGTTLQRIDGPYTDAAFGTSVAEIGDLNGDGRSEFIVGQPNALVTASNVGLANVYSGSDFALLHTFNGNYHMGHFGTSVAGAGDVNGDGKPDILIGQPDAGASSPGQIYIYSGIDWAQIRATAGVDFGGRMGAFVAGAGDVNGDGFADYLASEPYTTVGRGRVTVYSGVNGSALHTLNGETDNAYFGFSAAGVGDINGDGRADILVGAPYGNGTQRGTAYLYVTP